MPYGTASRVGGVARSTTRPAHLAEADVEILDQHQDHQSLQGSDRRLRADLAEDLGELQLLPV
jgi:hypothetical protein